MTRAYRQLAFNVEKARTSQPDADALEAFFKAWHADGAADMDNEQYAEWLNARPLEQFLAMMTWCTRKEEEERLQAASAA